MKPAWFRSPLVIVLMALVVFGVTVIGFRVGVFEPRLQRLERELRSAEKAETRAAAAKALGQMGAAARPAAPALVQALRDPNGRYLTRGFLIPHENNVKSDAYAALKNIGGLETAEAIVAALPVAKRGDEPWDYTSHGLALDVVAHIGKPARPVACRVLEGLDQVNNGVIVGRGLNALQAMEISPGTPDEVAAAKQVLPQFRSWSQGEGVKAAWLLYRMSPDDDDLLSMYVQAVAREPSPVPFELNPRTIRLLIRHLADTPNQGAITQLGRAEMADVLPALQEALHDPHARVRGGAASVLGDRGEAAAELAPEITPLLADENRGVQVAAARALWRIDKQAETTFPVLVAALESGDAAARDAARSFLNQIGPNDRWATSALAKAAGSASGKPTTIEALHILERIGPAATESVPTILELLKTEDSDIQRAAAKALAAIDKK